MSFKLKEELERRTIARLDKADPSNRDLADGVKLILNRLWSKEDLRSFIQTEQAAFCANCTRFKSHKLTPREKWIMGVVSTLITTLCGVLLYFTR